MKQRSSREEVRKLKTIRIYICLFDVDERHAEMLVDLGEDHALCGPDGDPGRVEIASSRDHRRFTVLENEVLARLSIEKVPGRMVQSSGTPFHDWIQAVAAGGVRLAALGECGFVAEIKDGKGDYIGLGVFLDEGGRGFLLRGLLVGQDLHLDGSHGHHMTVALVATQLLRQGALGLWSRDRLTYCPALSPAVEQGVRVARDIATERLAQLREFSERPEL